MNSNLHEEPTQSSAGEAETANRSTTPAPECVILDASVPIGLWKGRDIRGGSGTRWGTCVPVTEFPLE